VLWPWLSFTEPERLAVSIVAHQLKQNVLVPAIAVFEAEEELRRRIEQEIAKLDSAQQGLERVLGEDVDIIPEPSPDADTHIEKWRMRLEEFATVLPLSSEDADLALRREIEGRRPARPREKGKHGAGGRDTAVWLTIIRDHLAREEPGHLVSGDQKAFAGAQGQLHPALSMEVREGGGCTIDYYNEVAQLVKTLGQTAPSRSIDAATLPQLAGRTIATALRDSMEVPRAIWSDLHPTLRYRTEVTSAEALAVLSQRRYLQGDDGVLALNTHWEVAVDALWQSRDTDSPQTWSVIDKIELSGEVQLLIEEREGELGAAEMIGAQFSSPRTLSLEPDGSVVSMEQQLLD
jgi:hypothetical protein